MIIAVTGATGFVGRHVMQQFIQAGRNVRALARDPAKLPVAASVTPVQGDLNDRNALAELCKGASAVLHIAGAISGSATDMLRVNAEGTAALLNAADRAGVRRVVHVSSLAAREPDLSPYGLSKARGEQAVHAASRSLQTLIIRPPAVYGEGDAATLPLLKALLARTAILPGLATAHFSLIHGEDLARILVAAVDDTVEGLREVDDGHGAYTWAQVAEVMRGLSGRPQRLLFVPKSAALLLGHGADGVSAIMRRPGMISAGKMRELYHPDWVARAPGWPRAHAIPLDAGLHRTLKHAMVHGLLRHLPLADRSPTS